MKSCSISLRLELIEEPNEMKTEVMKFNGTIKFTVKGCTKLPDTDSAFFNLVGKDLTDPLVAIEINGKEVFRTPYISNCLDPVWKEGNKHDYKAEDLEIKEILFRVKDKETIGSETVGSKIFDADEMKALYTGKKEISGEYALRTKSGIGEYLPEARLNLEIKYEPGEFAPTKDERIDKL